MRYVLAARVLHWLMALGFLFMWVAGFTMTTIVEDDSPIEELLFDLHISIGMSLGCLLIVRIAIRLLFKPPALPDGISPLERRGAHLGHAALYALPAAVILVGWIGMNLAGHGGQWFGVKLPHMLPEVEAAEDVTEGMHMWLAYIMAGAAVVHVLAALKHRYLDGHDVISRMTFGRRP